MIALLKAIIDVLFARWKTKNDPSVAQREDAIDADYQKRREDLERR